eukprot:6212520-Pleurochrysis_carterae.AAC.2
MPAVRQDYVVCGTGTTTYTQTQVAWAAFSTGDTNASIVGHYTQHAEIVLSLPAILKLRDIISGFVNHLHHILINIKLQGKDFFLDRLANV